MSPTRVRNYGRAALLGIALALLLLPLAESPRELANSDWTPILVGGRLAVSDPSHLYDRVAQLHEQQRLLGSGGFSAPGQGALLPFVFPPWLALGVAPLAGLGLEWGGRAWILLTTLALGGGLLLAARSRWEALAAFAGFPAALAVSNAQADGLVVLGLGAGWRLAAARPLLAGLALTPALAKPHLVVGVAAGLVVARRWRTLAGWALGAGLLVGLTELRDRALVPAWLHSLGAVAGASRFEVGLPAIAWAFWPAAALPLALLAAGAAAALAARAPAPRSAAGSLVLGSLVAAVHALGSDLTLASASLALAGRARRLPLLLLSLASAAYALLHQPLVAAAVSLGLAGGAVWLSRQGGEEQEAPQHQGP